MARNREPLPEPVREPPELFPEPVPPVTEPIESSVNVEREISGNTTNVTAMIAWYDSRARFCTAA